MPNRDNPLDKVLNRKAFAWEEGKQPLIRDVMLARAKAEAHDKLTVVNNGLALNPKSVLGKVKPRAASWQMADFLQPYEVDESLVILENLLDLLNSKVSEVSSESESWLVDALGYETRAALKKQKAAQSEKEQLKKDAFAFKISKLKREPDAQYGDALNRLVCQTADRIGEESTSEGGRGNMAEADRLAREQVEQSLGDTDIEDYLTEKVSKQLETRLQNYYKMGLSKLHNEEKAVDFAGFMFEIDSRKTNEVWQGKKKKFEDILVRGLNGEPINLVSMFCTINEYDFNGHYTLIHDLHAYEKRDDVQLEPVPLIIDELAKVAEFFQFYGVKALMTLYVADADYIECRECGPVLDENIQNLQTYIKNLENYLKIRNFPVEVMFISEATKDNSVYHRVKTRIWENVSTMQNPAFVKEWSKAFEEDFSKRLESQKKRKFFSDLEIETETRELVKRIWSVNGAQGAFFGTLHENTIMISTERRERDNNYIIDQETRDQFIPVLYILYAADNWTRKKTQKGVG